MNLTLSLAAFFITPHGMAPAILWLINILVGVLFLYIVWLIIRKVAGKLGVDGDIVNLIGLILFLIFILFLFSGCATTTTITRADGKTITTTQKVDSNVFSLVGQGIGSALSFFLPQSDK